MLISVFILIFPAPKKNQSILTQENNNYQTLVASEIESPLQLNKTDKLKASLTLT